MCGYPGAWILGKWCFGLGLGNVEKRVYVVYLIRLQKKSEVVVCFVVFCQGVACASVSVEGSQGVVVMGRTVGDGTKSPVRCIKIQAA